MSSSAGEDDSDSADSASVHESFLPEWQGDEVACEVCGDAGGAASLMICDNVDKGCIGARHIYCCEPVREEVPPEDAPWHCDFCCEHGFHQKPYAPAGIGLDDGTAHSPSVSAARDSETPEADSGSLPASSSPRVPSSSSPGGSRDSAAAAQDAQRRAAAAAAEAEAAAEVASSAGVSAVAAGSAQPAVKQPPAAQRENGERQPARTDSEGASADTGSRKQQSSQPLQQDSKQSALEQQRPAKILPAKRKAEAAAAVPELHDGWAKLARTEAAHSKQPAASGGVAKPLPKPPPVKTSGTSKAQQRPVVARPGGGRGGGAPRLQDDDSLFESASPRTLAAAGAAAVQAGRSGLDPPGAQRAEPGGSASAPQQQQKRPQARPDSSSRKPEASGGLLRTQQPLGPIQQQRRLLPLPAPPKQQQQQQQQQQRDISHLPGQVRGEAGGAAGSGVAPTLEHPKRPPPSTVNIFSSIMSDMQSKAKDMNAHEEEMLHEAEQRKKDEQKALDAERKETVASRGAALWSGTMRVREVPLETEDPSGAAPLGRGQKPEDGDHLSEPIHLVAFALGHGADSAGGAAALPTQFEARTVSIDDIDLKYVDAHKGAALAISANTADAAGVMRVASLCRTLMQRGAALRAELPASKAWLALVPNPPDGGPPLLWGLFVTAGEQPQPRHRHIRPPRSALKQAGQRGRRDLRWVDGRRNDARAEVVERGPGRAYSDATAAATAASAPAAAPAAGGEPSKQQSAVQQQREPAPPSPTKGRQRTGWHHASAAGQLDTPQTTQPSQQLSGQPPRGQLAATQQRQPQQQPQPQPQPRPNGQAQLANADGAPGRATPVLPPSTSAAPPANGVHAPKLPLRGFRFSVVGYALGQDKSTDAHRALAGARALGAEHYRFPVTPGSVNALLLHPGMCQGGLEYNQWELCIKDFVLKPPIAFYRGLEYVTLAARLGRRPTPAEVVPFELLSCGITVISDAATLAADPDTLKQLYNALKRGMMGCKQRSGCTWAVRLSPLEHARLEDAYRRSHEKEVGQALQMFNSRLPGAGSGPALSARLTEEEVSSKAMPDPPQLVRDAVKVAYKHMTDCRHVILASGDRGLVAKASSQATVLACEGLGGALDLVTQIVDHLEATCHRPGELH